MTRLRIILDGVPGVQGKHPRFIGVETEKGDPYPLGGRGYAERGDGTCHLEIDLLEFAFGHRVTTPNDAKNAFLELSATLADLEITLAPQFPEHERAWLQREHQKAVAILGPVLERLSRAYEKPGNG